MAQVATSAIDVAVVDDFYFSALFDEAPAEVLPVSDAKYAEELQFQEALVSSAEATRNQTTIVNPSFPSSSSSSASFLMSSATPSSMIVKVQIPMIGEDEDEEEEIGQSSQVYCEICAERKPTDEIFPNASCCAHTYCSDCIGRHVASKIQESLTVVACPGLDCRGVHELEIESCRSILPREVVESWDEALCQALLMECEKFYCPFKDCSAVLVREIGEEEEVIMESECPICHRLFCARCNVAWHSGVGCEEYERLNEDERGREDLMVTEMANEKKWKRCPRCKFYVEKIDGCLHISCRCNYQFCYGCGSEWTQTHDASCQRG
ncbi:E3 ubiquitin-protein ligase RSL1-like [Humulus lupulus]|uniref:E3 ubiquitin-protein ligase RSL1-like n=1 Tax=Humulus lupulus TaxID=3486 RepID=UPI002B411EE6|nr:E3 ubiquitin-protein ligase RSL1-like [Humulus lupulus]